MVANGRKFEWSRVAAGVVLILGDQRFCVDILLISLGDFGADLGVNWLRTLGPINWDFDAMGMSFHKHGSNINLFGLQEVPVIAKKFSISLSSTAQLKELLSEFGYFFWSQQVCRWRAD